MLLVLVSTAAATPDARTPHGLQTAIARLVAFFIANPAARTPDALLGIQIGQCKCDFGVSSLFMYSVCVT